MNNKFDIITDYKLRVDGEILESCDIISVELKDGTRLNSVTIDSINADSIIVQLLDSYVKINISKILYITI